MALTDTVFYVNYGDGSTTGYYAVTPWATLTTKVCGNLIRQLATPTVGNERVFACISSTGGTGATGASEPTWVLTRGGKTTDATLVWQEVTGLTAFNGDLANTAPWTAIKNTVVTLGQVIQNVAGTLLLLCTTGGTAGNGSEPSWAAFTNAGATTADNTVTWTTMGSSSAYSIWNAPIARIPNTPNVTGSGSGSYTFLISSISAETQSGDWNLACSNTSMNYVCVSNTPGSVPPGSSDVTTGASVTVTGSHLLSITNAIGYFQGIAFTTVNTPGVISVPGSGNHGIRLDSCQLNSTGTANPAWQFFSTATQLRVDLNNTTFSFNRSGTGSQGFEVAAVYLNWKNTASAINGSSLPNILVADYGGIQAFSTVVFEGIDLNAFGNTIINTAFGMFVMKDCKLNSATAAPASVGGEGYVDLVRCDSGTSTVRNERWGLGGNFTTSTKVVRTAGASADSVAFSWNVSTTNVSSSSYPSWQTPFECWPWAIDNTTTSSNVTVTWYGVYNGTSLPNNDQVWGDAEYFGSSSSPLGSFQTGTKANILASGSPLTADTSAWDSAATARQNSHTYAIGDIIAVSSNSGRIFFCTTAGTSSGSLPGGYASAVDGGSVTDGAATFRAGMRFRQAITLSSPQPQLAGDIYLTIKAALASSTFFVDPKAVL